MKNKYVIEGDSVFIELRRKTGPAVWTVIDLADFEKLAAWPNRWWLTTARSLAGPIKHYVGSEISKGGRGKRTRAMVLLHRYLTDAPKQLDVDHWDKNPLNNRRKSNLRVVERAINVQNTAMQKSNTSGYVGVSFHAMTGKWRARITVDGKRQSLGLYDTPKEAGAAYQRASEAQGFGEEYARKTANYCPAEVSPSTVRQDRPEVCFIHLPTPELPAERWV